MKLHTNKLYKTASNKLHSITRNFILIKTVIFIFFIRLSLSQSHFWNFQGHCKAILNIDKYFKYAALIQQNLKYVLLIYMYLQYALNKIYSMLTILIIKYTACINFKIIISSFNIILILIFCEVFINQSLLNFYSKILSFNFG